MEQQRPFFTEQESHNNIAVRQQALAENFANFMAACQAGEQTSGLRAYQAPAFDDLHTFLCEDEVIKSGYLDLPTSYGKTVIIAKALLAMGIGRSPPLQPQGDKLRALILVPSRDAREQTLGPEGTQKGLRHFAKDIDAAIYKGSRPLDQSAIIMTYQAFVRPQAQQWLATQHIDALICDEAHHSLGGLTSAAVSNFMQDKLAIALTATPEYGPNKHLGQLFGERIHKSDFRSLIEDGHINGVQLVGLATDCEITANNRQLDFSEASLNELAHNDGRNQAIVDLTKYLISEGRRGIVNCIKGEGYYHSRLLQEMLNGQEVEILNDDGTITKRAIRAAAVGKGIKGSDQVLKDFHDGLYDVLTQVQLIDENWDNDDVSFIINACPTLSPVKATQRFGRGMRLNKEWPVTVVVEFLDRIRHSRREQYTGWHILGEENMEQGVTIASPAVKRTITTRRLGGAAVGRRRTRSNIVKVDDLPKPLYKMSNEYTAVVAKEFLLKAQRRGEHLPPGYKPLVYLMPLVSHTGIGIDGIRSLLDNNGFKSVIAAGKTIGHESDKSVIGVPAGAEIFLKNYKFPKIAAADQKPKTQIADELGVSHEFVDSAINALKDLQPQELVTRKRRLLTNHYGEKDYNKIKEWIEARKAEVPKEEDGLIALGKLATEIGEERNTVRYFLLLHHSVSGRDLASSENYKKATYFTKAEADIARWHFSHQRITGKAKTLERIQQNAHASEDDTLAAITTLGVEQNFFKGRYTDASGRYAYTLFCDDDTYNKVVNALQARTPDAGHAVHEIRTKHPSEIPSNYIDMYDCLRRAKCDPLAMPTIMRRITRAANTLLKASDGSVWVASYLAEIFKAECHPQVVEKAPLTFMSLQNLAVRWHMSPQKTHELVLGTDPNPTQLGVYAVNKGEHYVTVHYSPTLIKKVERWAHAQGIELGKL